MMGNNQTVVVIGAGLVGMCSALRLQQSGYRVRVVDPGLPGDGASMGNPGGLSVTSIFPMSVPGIARQVPGWIFDPLGPLSIRWQHVPALSPWMLRFIKAAKPAQVNKAVAALYALTAPAVARYQELSALANASELIRADGHLMIYRTAAAMHSENTGWARRAALGIRFETIDAATLHDMEPELDPAFQFARYVPGNGHCVDPRKLAQRFADALVQNGGAISRTAAHGFHIRDGKAVGVQTASGDFAAEHIVLAAGAHSRLLAAQLGNKIPLEPERGYHVQVTQSKIVLKRPVFSTEAKVFAASMTDGLRFAGTAEFAGAQAAPDWRRADGLLTLGKGMFPRLAAEAKTTPLTRWMGFRPSTPDSLPVIGQAQAAGNVILAFGHGHIGVTSAPMTGEIVTSLIKGDSPAIDITPYSPNRF